MISQKVEKSLCWAGLKLWVYTLWPEMFGRSPGWHMKQQNVIPCPNGTLVASCVKLQMCIAWMHMMHPSQDFNRKWSLSLEFSFQTHGKLVVCPSSHWESWEADPSNDIYIFLHYIDVKKEMHDKCQLFAGCTCIHRYTFLLINRYTDIYIYCIQYIMYAYQQVRVWHVTYAKNNMP